MHAEAPLQRTGRQKSNTGLFEGQAHAREHRPCTSPGMGRGSVNFYDETRDLIILKSKNHHRKKKKTYLKKGRGVMFFRVLF
jgi:hypothetical protein